MRYRQMGNEAEHERTFEDIIDKTSLAYVLLCLAAVCHDKADHVRSNWQDAGLAGAWERAATILDKTITRLPSYPMIDH